MRDIIDVIEDGDISEVISLLDAQPELITFQPYGDTPLHVAVERDRPDVVTLLLTRGADVNASGNNGRTPLHLAAARGKYEIAKLLLGHQPDLERTDDYGFTPLLTAARNGEQEVADLLIQHGANFDLHSAVSLGRAERVHELLHNDPDAVTKTRFKNDLLPDAVYARLPEIVRELLAQPEIDVNAYGLSGEPPIVAAVSRTDYIPEIIRLLLEHGANPRLTSSSGDTAFSRAELVGIKDASKLLHIDSP